MKKKLAIVLVMLQLALCAAGVSAENEDYTKGLSFQNAGQHYTTTGTLSKYPQTFEATVYFPADTPTDEAYAKTVIGNYTVDAKVLGVDFQIFNGKPRLVWVNGGYSSSSVEFNEVNVYTGGWVHIAITALRSSTRDFKCYINGELAQTVTSSSNRYYWEKTPGYIGKTSVGGGWSGSNSRYFKDGVIKNIAVYHDIRTADEIVSDSTVARSGGTMDYSDILMHYDFSDIPVGTHPEIGGTIEDKSAAEGVTADDLVYDSWIDPEDMPARSRDSYDFSLAVIGDIQCINYFHYDPQTQTNPAMSKMFDWVVANKDAKKMAGAVVLGDLTQTSESGTETPLPDDMEWKMARAEVDKLKAAMPVSVVRGNHDNTGEYVNYFPYADFADGIDGCYIDTTNEAEVTEGYTDSRDTYTDVEQYQKQANMLNTYQKLTVGEQKYLILNLDIGAADDVLAWASDVCEEFSDHTVIVNTHAYLNGAREMYHTSFYSSSPAYSAAYWKLGARNNGDDLWNKFLKKHENISLVLCGHYSSERIVVEKQTGDYGNEVTSLLIDPQTLDKFGATDDGEAYGMVAMLYFKDGGKTIDVEWYSTARDKYLLQSCQFTEDIHTTVVKDQDETVTHGLSFQNEAQHYSTSGVISEVPRTFEATVYFPKVLIEDGRARNIIGNYITDDMEGVQLQIYNRKPRLQWVNGSRSKYSVYFDEVESVYRGKWVHIAVTLGTSKEFKCYIDGTLVQTVTETSGYGTSWSRSQYFVRETMVGGVYAGANTRYFKDGIIKNIAVYNDIRSDEEIAADCGVAKNGGTVDYSGILMHYDFSDIPLGTHPEIGGTIEDKSAAEGDTADDLVYDSWIDPEDMPERDSESYDFSLAVIGDIQCINAYHVDSEGKNPSMTKLFDWVIANKDSKKMAGAFVLGDLVENGISTGISPVAAEWQRAKDEITKLKNAMPVSLIRGNHDDTEWYTSYFPYADFADGIDGCYIDTTDEAEVTAGYSDSRDTYTDVEPYQKQANMLNTYQKLRVGEQKYLILNLDIGAADDVLEWANGVCKAHPDYTVIVNTHAYLNGGTKKYHTASYESSPAYSARYWRLGARNNGNDIWNKFLRKHKNISLVLCGHYSSEQIAVNKMTGDNGNEITTMLIDPQTLDAFGATDNGEAYGMVAMLYFKDGGKTIDVEWYSTARDKYLLQSCQFTEELTVAQTMRVSDVAYAGTSGSAVIIGDTENTKNNPEISDGTVSFAFAEGERENRVVVTTGAADEDADGISASVSLSGEMEGLVYAALYNHAGQMMEFEVKQPAESLRFDFEAAGSEVKVFWWESAVDSLTAPAKITFQ